MVCHILKFFNLASVKTKWKRFIHWTRVDCGFSDDVADKKMCIILFTSEIKFLINYNICLRNTKKCTLYQENFHSNWIHLNYWRVLLTTCTDNDNALHWMNKLRISWKMTTMKVHEWVCAIKLVDIICSIGSWCSISFNNHYNWIPIKIERIVAIRNLL